MNDIEAETPAGELADTVDAPSSAPTHGRAVSRRRAVAEAALCSSYPTQLAIAALLSLAGVSGQPVGGGLDVRFALLVPIVDTVLVLGLIGYFLRRSGDTLHAVFVGTRPPIGELRLGVLLWPVVTMGTGLALVAIRRLVPTLHDVPVNPLGPLMADPAMAVLFGVVVVLAGGVREEAQRAFQLHRLAPTVMAPWAALLVTATAFGVGHTIQGSDVAIATGVLGFCWGLLYLRRGSAVAPAVSHGLFNLGQVVVAFTAGGRMGAGA